MKITREGSELLITIPSGIGYSLTFRHKCASDSDAEAWRVHAQAHQDQIDKTDMQDITDRLETIARLRRSISALRGCITKLRRQVAK